MVGIFLRIGDIFGEADPFNRPQLAVFRDRTDKEIPRFASQYVIAELDIKTVNHDLNDEFPLSL